MQKLIYLGLVWLMTTPALLAQDGLNATRERIEAFRVAFYTRELSLTSQEAERFWPVYNVYADEREENRQAQVRAQMALRRAYNSSGDEEVEARLDELLALKQEEGEITVRAFESFKEVLPMRKVALLMKAENDFRRKLLENLREQRQGRIGND